MIAIKVNDLTKQYKNITAIDHLSFSIVSGECFALLGQNGAGKTTTMKVLSCLIKQTDGDAFVFEKSVLKQPISIKRILSISPQETAVAAKLTVEENLYLMARVYGMKKSEAAKATEEMLIKYHLNDKRKERGKNLSGGMQRRLSLAMALISDPSVLFLDEPTLGLDVRARRALWDEIKRLKGKMTILLTTHYLEEAEAIADRIGIMDKGQMKAIGTSAEIKRLTGKDFLEDAFLALTEEE